MYSEFEVWSSEMPWPGKVYNLKTYKQVILQKENNVEIKAK
jgi:hypothetical protein